MFAFLRHDDAPTGTPTISTAPTTSSEPSSGPTISSAPTVSSEPSSGPTISSAPSVSMHPSANPSVSPAPSVSAQPTGEYNCFDDPNYINPINPNFGCEYYFLANIDCEEFSPLLTEEQVQALLESCPISCKVDCK